MPIYEFYCPNNNKIYSFFAKSISAGQLVPRCPDNPAYRMIKQISQVSVLLRSEDRAEADGLDEDGVDEARMDAAMAEMESEMTGMDEENPDPRQMGRMMRKMADLTGEKMEPAMQEMIGRLEAGEDFNKIEEQFADSLDKLGEGDTGDVPLTSGRPSAMSRRQPPSRDPQLYDLEDYT